VVYFETTLCDKVSSTNKTGRHDITEILLKVTLNTIILTPHIESAPYLNYRIDLISSFDVLKVGTDTFYLNKTKNLMFRLVFVFINLKLEVIGRSF
jgi:hypothetical protein